jgi:hypothetical protein
LNFGQKPFKYAPPQGFLPLNSASATPETVITRPDQFVGVTLYTGNGTGQSINTGQKPDFVWIKPRTVGNYHNLYDSVRGADKALFSNTTDGQVTYNGRLTSFDPSGFTVGNVSTGGVGTNENARPFVVWSWKAGGNKNTFNVDDVGYASAAAAGLGSGSLAVTGASVGTKQGFSIIKWQGNRANSTVSHGLNSAVKFYFVKNLDQSSDWLTWHTGLGGGDKFIRLNTTGGSASASTPWNSTIPTNSVFSLGADSEANGNGDDMIAYLWCDVPGLQKFGKYTGNGNADGPFVETGMRPALVVFKKSSASGDPWLVYDGGRNTFNLANRRLAWSNDSQESVSDNYAIDILSNGFKIRTSDTSWNANGATFIYAAWAESPFSNLYGGQSNAR